MTNSWFWILSVLVLGVVVLRSYGKSRLWTGASFLVAGVLVAWSVSPWAPASLGDGQLTDVCLIVVDVSESMGPEPSALFSKARLRPPKSGKLIVVAAGSQAQVCFDGLAEDYPDQLRPNQLNESMASRLKCDLVVAIETGMALLADDERANLQVVSDGGSDLDAAKVLLQGLRAQGVASLEVRTPGETKSENLGIRILGSSRSFVAGAKLPLAVEVFGYTSNKRYLTLRLAVPGLPDQEVLIQLEKGLVNRRLLVETLPLPASATKITVALKNLGPRDSRLADNQDTLLIRSDDRPLSVLLLEGEAATPLDVASLSPFLITRDPQRLTTADVVIVHDLDVQEGRVSRAFWSDLKAAVEQGAGLLLVGNRASFGLGHWDGHLLDDLSPLASKPGNKKRCLIVALDRSGSMENADRLKRAGRVVEETFARLSQGDRLVLLLFSSDVERFEFDKNDATSRQRLHQVVQEARANGGTNLSVVMDAIVAQEIEDTEDGLAFLLTDGRDSQSMTGPRVSRWSKSLRGKKLGLHLFWFDRDLSLRPILLQLVGTEDHLVDVDDFGALQKPFFQAMSKELIATKEELRLSNGAVFLFDRILRTRPQPDAEILASGSGKLTALAKIRRGLGQVAAAPIDFSSAARSGLWGDTALPGFLQSLARSRSNASGELQINLDNGMIRLQLAQWQSASAPLSLRLGGQTYPLRQTGPQQFRSDRLGEMPKSQLVEVNGENGTLLARLNLAAPRFVDVGPEPDSIGLAELSESFGAAPAPPRRSVSVHIGLLLLALVVLGVELLLGIRSSN